MAQIIVRNLSEVAVERLKARAKQSHRSLEAEVREILETEAERTPTAEERDEAVRFLDELRAKLAGKITRDSTDLIREDRDR
jgi:plasmid stability protein